MKSIALSSALAVLGTASTINAIVLPENSHFKSYPQFGVRSSSENVSPRALNNEGGSIKIPMYYQSKRDKTNPDDTLAFARQQLDYTLAKWGKNERAMKKRQEIGLSDVGQDNFYFGQVSVGTPKQNFNVILDTGSSDFWLVDTSCTNSQCQGVAAFNPSASSTYTGSNNPFSITYGTGAVQGTLSADSVSLAGYTVADQTFAIVDQLASNSLQAPTSGIMGMGFQSLAQSRATPFWQFLAEKGQLKQNAFTFQLARNVDDASSATQVNPGGVFTLGEIDSNQYSGSINYVDLTDQVGYWTIPLQSLSVNGQSGSISGDSASAIDTGTTLIIAPPSVASSIYQQISGAESVGGFSSSSEGTYSIPCNANVNVTMTFGGTAYSINSNDFNAGYLDTSGTKCLGGILGSDLGSGAPSFIVGDVFLKNVFSVFQYEPAAVGFASLKGASAQTLSTTSGAVGSGSNTAAASSASNSAGGNSPPLFSSLSADSSDTSIAAGSGLPSASAVGTLSANSATLTPASGANTQSTSSSASNLVANQFFSVSALIVALAFGMAYAL